VEEKKRTYLDDCKSPEEKTKAVIENLYDLIAFKGVSPKEVDKKIFNRQYLPSCKHYGTIEFGRLLKYCEYLGVSLDKLMTFSYKGIAKKKEIEEKEARLREIEAEAAKIRMQLKLDRQEQSNIYREANIKKMEV